MHYYIDNDFSGNRFNRPVFQQMIQDILAGKIECIVVEKLCVLGLTFATAALQNGVDIKTVSGMLGHYSAGFTLDTSAHVTTQAQRQAANTMGSILSKCRREPSGLGQGSTQAAIQTPKGHNEVESTGRLFRGAHPVLSVKNTTLRWKHGLPVRI